MKSTCLIGALLLLATTYAAHSEVSQQPYVGEGGGGPVDPAATEPGQTRKVPRRRPPARNQRPQADADDSAIPALPRRGESSGSALFLDGGNPSAGPRPATVSSGAANPGAARQQAAEVLAILRPILLQAAIRNPMLAQKLAVLEGLVANSPQEALAAMRPLLAEAAAKNPVLAKKLELLDALTLKPATDSISTAAAQTCSVEIERASRLGDELQRQQKGQHSYRRQIEKEAKYFLQEVACSQPEHMQRNIAQNEKVLRTQNYNNSLNDQYALARLQMAITCQRARLAECNSANRDIPTGTSRGLPIEECNRQANASDLGAKLNALPRSNTNLLTRGTIVNLDFLIRAYTPCLPYPQLQQQIDQWKAQRAQTLNVCRQTSTDPGSCLRSPF